MMNAQEHEQEARQDEEMRDACRRIARDGVMGTARRISQLEEINHRQQDRIDQLEQQVEVLESGEAIENLLDRCERQEEELARLRSLVEPVQYVVTAPGAELE